MNLETAYIHVPLGASILRSKDQKDLLQQQETPRSVRHVTIIHPDSKAHFTASSQPLGVQQIGGAANELAMTTIGRVETAEEMDVLCQYPDPDTGETRMTDILGISMPLGSLELVEEMISRTHTLAAERGEESPLIVLGGYIPTWMGGDDLTAFLQAHPGTIAVQIGGENPMLDIIERRRHNQDFRDLPGVWYLKDDNSVGYTPPNAHYNTTLSPRVTPHLLRKPGELYAVNCSQGCEKTCTFCTRPPLTGEIPLRLEERILRNHGETWEQRDHELILQEIAVIARLNETPSGQGAIFFPDEEFLGTRPEDFEQVELFLQKWEQAHAEGRIGHVPFEFSTRSDVLNLLKEKGMEGMLARFKKLGLERVFIGYESAVPANFKRWDKFPIPGQLGRYGKGCHPDEQITAIRLLEEHGIDVELGTIFFDPLVDIGEIEHNFRTMRDEELVSYCNTPLSELRVQAGSNTRVLTNRLLVKLRREGHVPPDTTLFTDNYDPSPMSHEYRFLHPLVEELMAIVKQANQETHSARRAVKQLFRTGMYSGTGVSDNLGLRTLTALSREDANLLLGITGLIRTEMDRRRLLLEQYDVLAPELTTLVQNSGLLQQYRTNRNAIWREYADHPEAIGKEAVEEIIENSQATA